MESDQPQFGQCPNCQRDFSVDRIQLHEAYCSRNFHKCQKCGSMVDKNYVQEHQKQFHATKKCEYCSKTYSVSEQLAHEQLCQFRPQLCDFCQNKYPKNTFSKHVQACGSRTKECGVCGKPVQLKSYDSHVQRCVDKLERRQRRQSSQNPRTQQQIQYSHHFQQRQLYRQNSTNQIKTLENNLNRREQIIESGENGRQRIQQRQRDNNNIRDMRQANSKQKNKGRGKIPKVKKKDFIQPEPIRPVIDPVPISVRIALKVKNNKQYQ